jgi:hypothetical protein
MTSPTVSVPPLTRPEQLFKISRTNRPTVNSLMHLYGPWILDACLLQIKDRYSRSSTTNEGKSYLFNSSTIKLIFLAYRMNETLDIQVRKTKFS